jgi:hypothetical protein
MQISYERTRCIMIEPYGHGSVSGLIVPEAQDIPADCRRFNQKALYFKRIRLLSPAISMTGYLPNEQGSSGKPSRNLIIREPCSGSYNHHTQEAMGSIYRRPLGLVIGNSLMSWRYLPCLPTVGTFDFVSFQDCDDGHITIIPLAKHNPLGEDSTSVDKGVLKTSEVSINVHGNIPRV